MRRTGYTLIELTIVIVLMGVFLAIATQGFVAWRRSTAEQQALTDVVDLLTRCGANARHRLKPYQVHLSRSGTDVKLAGKKWQLKSGSPDQSEFVPDLDLELPGRYIKSVVFPDGGSQGDWTIDLGIQPQDWTMKILLESDGGTRPWRVTLGQDGRVTVKRDHPDADGVAGAQETSA